MRKYIRKYAIGYTVGDITVERFEPSRGYYHMVCKCGKELRGSASFVTTKVNTYNKHSYTGCQLCWNKYLATRVEYNSDEYFHDIYKRYTRRGRDLNIEFALTKEQCTQLFKSPCYYCGELPKIRSLAITKLKNKLIESNGIDRLQSNLGYTVENTVACCKSCNYAKHILNYDQFIDKVKKIYSIHVQRLERELVDPSGSKRKTP